MSTPHLLSPEEPKNQLFQKWTPFARFQIPSELKGKQYERLLSTLWVEFIRSLSAHQKNQHAGDRFYFSEPGAQGGTETFYIGDAHFPGCKMYLYDDSDQRSIWSWHGMCLRDHTELRSMVEAVYTIAEKWEQFLNKRQIPHQRFGQAVGTHEEVWQATES